MDVERSDQGATRRAAGVHRKLRDHAPGPDPSTTMAISVPKDWPEAVLYRAGWRLFREGNDAVWTLIRSGLPLYEDVTADEWGSWTALGTLDAERWLRLGWSRAAEREEGE